MTVQMIEVLNPTAKPQSVEFEIASRIDDLNGKVIGFLDNGKPNIDIFLARMEELLCKRFKFSEIVHVNKVRQVGAGAALPSEQMEKLLKKCHVVVNGVAD